MNTAIDAIRQESAAGGLPSLWSRIAERRPLDDPSFLPSPRLFEARRLAIACIVGRDGRACAEFPREAQVSAVLQDWITHKDWRHSQSASETAFQLANDTRLSMFQWLEPHSTARKQFAVAVQAIDGCYSQGALADYPWRSLPPTQVLVDCGGGQGAFSIAL
ncbi:hypothetical protein A0H81_13342 [Grifola frondosa]|uniref:Uncharacterized protein n=1 Tax=Grifola frondosa TaxID=5627 RepID=A0A1C7LQL5_GRIFR|nr:hypothetical protein A0H81_13342 [Grifola frondosa]